MIDSEEVFYDGDYIDYWIDLIDEAKELNEELRKYRLENKQVNEEKEG